MTFDIDTLLPTVLDFMLDMVFVVDREGIIVHVNDACNGVLGYRPDDMIGRPLADFQAPQDRERTAREAADILAGARHVGFENCYRHRDGHLVHLMWSARCLPAQRLRIGVARDIGRRRLVELREAAAHAILEASHTAPDMATLCRQIQRAFEGIVPVTLLAIVLDTGDGGIDAIHVDGRLAPGESPCDWYRDGTAAAAAPPVCLRFPHEHGLAGALYLRYPEEHGRMPALHDTLRFLAGCAALALERRRLLAGLARAAQYDELTGLPNRRLFHDRLATAVARATRKGSRLALLFADVDRFKQVNDRYGHATGDLLLREIAARLQRCARESDTVARLSGDEFVILVEELATPGDARTIADHIAAAMAAPVAVPGASLDVSLSLGIAVYPDDTSHPAALLAAADGAMYASKRAAARTALAHPS
ncbi:diguanylate cyclase domain-containing protein [uncultured Massilia sp.]|uniref:diguanylate cyclase domain-containing protein n=1 Tax=uncultured Massilia sp. TaxID=169973 RepID=UPI0025DEB098|nr:diguanylate cyclase [uncultured Massilia sp.]